ncbi:MAG TPA: FAD-dependent oxidoreductase [Magnetospirillum sp.]|nr:FAD-dependent oxidoreductase [Magnetospirillum sp.]
MPSPHPSPSLRTLFSPIRLNGLELPNRVFMNGLHLGFEKRPDPFAAMAHFHKVRANGGAGLLLAGGCSPNRVGRPMADGFSIEHDDTISKHRAITQAVHSRGGLIALQLVHFGREAFHRDLVAPSPGRAGNNVFRPAALGEDDILATIADFGQAARRAREAGYDAIEVVGSQGFLLHQFLARHINLRKDGWGGDIDGRMRFARLVLRACRERAGADFPIVFRLPALDLMPGCNGSEDVLAILEMARQERVDMVNVGIGTHESPVPTIALSVPPAGFAAVAHFIKRHAGAMPVAVSNRINDPRLAEALLLEGVADMVAVGRPLLADAEFVGKARANAFDSINTCIACNQSCLDKALFGQEVGCTLNPQCATPGEGRMEAAARPLNIAVVGAGIAGLTAAATLARRGHRVDVIEQRARLGGQLLLAARIPGKHEFLRTVAHFEDVLPRLGVELRLGRKAEPEALAAQGYDHVFVATGTRPRTLEVPSDGSVAVVGYEDLLRHDLPVAYPVVVVGGGGIALDVSLYLAARPGVMEESERYLRANLPAAEAARLLAGADVRRRQVTILQRSEGKLAPKVGATTRWGLLREIEHLGVAQVKGATLLGLRSGQVHYQHRSGAQAAIPAATVVLAIGQELDRALLDGLERIGLPYTLVGGAGQSGDNITTSVRSAYEAAVAL